MNMVRIFHDDPSYPYYLDRIIISPYYLDMESLQKINTLIEELPIENEWVYIQICNEMKKVHLKLQELQGKVKTTATLDPSAPPCTTA